MEISKNGRWIIPFKELIRLRVKEIIYMNDKKANTNIYNMIVMYYYK